MKKVFTLLLLCFVGATSWAQAQTTEDKMPPPMKDQKPNKKPSKMKACNEEAKDKGLKGEDRKKMMSACLKGGVKPSDAAPYK